jgi:hypothetical protein
MRKPSSLRAAPPATPPGERNAEIEVPDALLDALADRLASKVADRLAIPRPPSASPWMTFEELATHTKIAKGTLLKLGAEGTFQAHGGKRKLYHREEVDTALLGMPMPQLGHTMTSTTWDTYVHLFEARRHAQDARDATGGRVRRHAQQG